MRSRGVMDGVRWRGVEMGRCVCGGESGGGDAGETTGEVGDGPEIRGERGAEGGDRNRGASRGGRKLGKNTLLTAH